MLLLVALKWQEYCRYLKFFHLIKLLIFSVQKIYLHFESRNILKCLLDVPWILQAVQQWISTVIRWMVSFVQFCWFAADSARGTAGFSTDTIQVTPTERIFLSLLCPLPNEQDFAINVCSLLAIENRKPFPLRQCPRIIDALLAHAGVFSQGLHQTNSTTTPTTPRPPRKSSPVDPREEKC